MPCQRCNSGRIISISAKCSDMFYADYARNTYEGYVPKNIGLGDNSDCVNISYCLDCGQIQGKFPIAEGDVRNGLDISDEPYDLVITSIMYGGDREFHVRDPKMPRELTLRETPRDADINAVLDELTRIIGVEVYDYSIDHRRPRDNQGPSFTWGQKSQKV